MSIIRSGGARVQSSRMLSDKVSGLLLTCCKGGAGGGMNVDFSREEVRTFVSGDSWVVGRRLSVGSSSWCNRHVQNDWVWDARSGDCVVSF